LRERRHRILDLDKIIFIIVRKTFSLSRTFKNYIKQKIVSIVKIRILLAGESEIYIRYKWTRHTIFNTAVSAFAIASQIELIKQFVKNNATVKFFRKKLKAHENLHVFSFASVLYECCFKQ